MELLSEEALLMLSLATTALLLFLSVYFMITLSDLESDYINSRQCGARLNLCTPPRLLLLLLHSALLLASPWLLLLSLPATIWLIRRWWKVPAGKIFLLFFFPCSLYHSLHVKKGLVQI